MRAINNNNDTRQESTCTSSPGAAPSTSRRTFSILCAATLLLYCNLASSQTQPQAVRPTAAAPVERGPAEKLNLSEWGAANAEQLAVIQQVGQAQARRPQHQRINEVIVFGDSLSDVGSYQVGDIAAAGGGKFTTNPGPMWPEPIGWLLGAPVTPFRVGFGAVSSVVGGTGFAMGGARVSQSPGLGCEPEPVTGVCTAALALPVTQQITDYLESHGNRFTARQLVFMFAGSNDMFVQLEQFSARVQAGAPVEHSEAQALAAVRQTATELAGQVRRILARGATRVGVLTLLDIADTPFANEPANAPAKPLMSAMASAFNSTLTAQLQGSGAQMIKVDEEGKRVMGNPGLFQVTETRVPACDAAKIAALTQGAEQTGSSLLCSSQTLVQNGAGWQYLFADGTHPSSLDQAIIARFVLTEAARLGLL